MTADRFMGKSAILFLASILMLTKDLSRQANLSRFLIIVTALLVCVSSANADRSVININPSWKFHLGTLESDPIQNNFDDSAWNTVALPHTFKEVSLQLDQIEDDRSQKTFHRYVGWYRRTLPDGIKGASKRTYLVFQGAMQTTELWVNGTRVGRYEVSGYDSFHFDITSFLRYGENRVAVKVDNSVNNNTPPDGEEAPKDFILFGGLYRDVQLVTTDDLHITFPWEGKNMGVRVTTPMVSPEVASIVIETAVKNDGGNASEYEIITEISDKNGQIVKILSNKVSTGAGEVSLVKQTVDRLANPMLWTPGTPSLYTATTKINRSGVVNDKIATRFGIRSVEFNATDGFLLNGKKLKLVGANRHQTWPFIGNAVPNRLHRQDAIQMHEAGFNWVRLSHYPHDPDFLDACDELGLMALEEGPTWMRMHGEVWFSNLKKSIASMIRRDRNHPSIITWNACINHADYNEELGQICKEEDNRPIGALMPPTPMNFKHKTASGKGALTIEHTGHTYPRKRGMIWSSGESAEIELARRHLEHVDGAYKVKDNSGLAVWCMYDYNTYHNSDEMGFTWHGVCDLLRIPKASFFWYKSELTEAPCLYLSRESFKKAIVFSNCENVELFQDIGDGLKSLGTQKSDSGYTLNHPPFSFDISDGALILKAVGINGNKAVVESIWRKAFAPRGLAIEADSQTLVADGGDMTRLIVTVVDESKTPVPHIATAIYFDVEGQAEIVGTNPAPVRAGKAGVLVRAGYSAEPVIIKAHAALLGSTSLQIQMIAPDASVDMPEKRPSVKLVPALKEKSHLYLADLDWTYGYAVEELSVNRGILALKSFEFNKKDYKDCLVVKTPSEVVYTLGGLYDRMDAQLVATVPGMIYEVYIDNKKVMEKNNLKKDEVITVSLKDAWSLRLVARAEIDQGAMNKKKANATAIWSDVKLYVADKAAQIQPILDNVSKAGGSKGSDQVEPFNIPPVRDTNPGKWAQSENIMIAGDADSYPITIEGGQYRIYAGPWNSKQGSVVPGDAVTFRMKSSEKPGETVKAKINVGSFRTEFTVTTSK